MAEEPCNGVRDVVPWRRRDEPIQVMVDVETPRRMQHVDKNGRVARIKDRGLAVPIAFVGAVVVGAVPRIFIDKAGDDVGVKVSNRPLECLTMG